MVRKQFRISNSKKVFWSDFLVPNKKRTNNQPRTAKVGAISKAQKWKNWRGALWGLEKNIPKSLKMRFLNSVTVPKNVKCERGSLWDFLTSIVLQNVETSEGGPFGAIQKVSTKCGLVPKKKWGYGGILSVISRFWTSVLFLLFVMDALLRFQLLRLEVVEVWRCWTNEQKNGPYAS